MDRKNNVWHRNYSDRPTQIVRHYVYRQPDKRRQRHMHETDWQHIKNSNAIIFARAALVNRYIIPKIIYTATAITISTHFIKLTNKHIRKFILKISLGI